MSRTPRTVEDVIRANLGAMSREQIADYAFTLEGLLCERERLLEAVPDCPDHGPGCVPFALEWVARARDDYAAPIHCCPTAQPKETAG